MRHLDAILGTLLLRNNCVIIPDLGGFVANPVAAKIDAVKGIIMPPKKAISFNLNLINNDGLLANFLSNEKQLPYQEAVRILSAEIQQIKIDLKKGLRVSFINVGYIYQNDVGKIAFEQDRFFNLLLSSYGMGSVHFIAEEVAVETKTVVPTTIKKEVQKEERTPIITFHPQPKEKTAVKSVDRTDVLPKKQRIVVEPTQRKSKYFFGRVAKYTAVASLAAILFYSIWIPMQTDVLQSGIIYSTDFNPFINKTTAKYQLKRNSGDFSLQPYQSTNVLAAITNNLNTTTQVFAYPLDDDKFIPVCRKQSTPTTFVEDTSTNIVSESKDRKASSTKLFQGKYDVIAGCFSNPSNAKEFIKLLQENGFEAYQVDVQGGLHRISAGNFNAKLDVQNARNLLNKKGISSWVLKH